MREPANFILRDQDLDSSDIGYVGAHFWVHLIHKPTGVEVCARGISGVKARESALLCLRAALTADATLPKLLRIADEARNVCQRIGRLRAALEDLTRAPGECSICGEMNCHSDHK